MGRSDGFTLPPSERLGIEPLLATVGIEYLWAVELGNPQTKDPTMRVLWEHLAPPVGPSPSDSNRSMVS